MSFKRHVVDRFSEPSTYAGLAGVVAGLGQMFQVNEAGPVADALSQVAVNPTWQNGLIVGLGLLAMFKREKAR